MYYILIHFFNEYQYRNIEKYWLYSMVIHFVDSWFGVSYFDGLLSMMDNKKHWIILLLNMVYGRYQES